MRRIGLLLLLITTLCSTHLFAQNNIEDIKHHPQNNFFDICNQANDYFESNLKSGENSPEPAYDKAYHKFKRWEWYWKDRVNADGSFPDLSKRQEAYQQLNTTLKSAHSDIPVPEWTNINQKTCTGGYNGMGRTTAIAFHPTNPDIFYVGAPIGGIWKTTDGGKTYTPKGDNLPHVGVGCIAINHENPDIMYISISDNTGWWHYSLGVYKSTDAGETWKPTGLTFSFSDGIAIYNMAIDPNNANVLIAATADGLYKTSNAGQYWQRQKSGSWGDVKFSSDGSTIYAASYDYWGKSQIYRSTNAGYAWEKISSFNTKKTRIRLAVTPANPKMLVALSTADKEIYVSKDRGTTLTNKAKAKETQFVYISPANEDIIYHGYVSVYQSKNGGTSSEKITMWYGGTELPEVHADHHFATYNPLTGYLYFCNDGGVYRYHEGNNTWKEFSNGLVITQYYKMAVAQTHPVFMIGGTQDNGGRKRNADGTWSSTNGGDAMEVAIDPTNENIFYTTYCNGEIFRTTNGWVTNTRISDNIPGEIKGAWVTPYVLEPQNPSTIVAGYADVYRSTNRGGSWSKLSTNLTGSSDRHLNCIAVAPSNRNVIYATSGNTIYKTPDLGINWDTISYFETSRDISSLLIQPENDDTLWVSFGGYEGSKVFQSNNGGTSWNDISHNLPPVPVNVLISDTAQSNNALYAGTDVGVFFMNDTMSQWQYHGSGLPNTSVTDMDIQYATRKLRISTYGRGIWETTLYGETPNLLPFVNLQTPENNYHVSAGERITISAHAADEDGEIESLAFYNGPVKLGELSEAPYELSLNAMPAGEYSLFARAIDNRGSIGESERITVVVDCQESGKLSGNIIGTSGTWGNGNTKEKAMDGNINTFYDANTAYNGWVGLSFTDAHPIQGIRYYPRQGQRYRMVGGKFQGCNSPEFDSNVTTLYEITNEPPLEWNCLNIASEQTFRYVRYLSPGGGYCNVAEVEFYGLGTTSASSVENSKSTRIYPNPFRNKLTIEHPFNEAKVTVCNSAGIVIDCQTSTTMGKTEISFPNTCKNGLYFVTLQHGKDVFYHKVLKMD